MLIIELFVQLFHVLSSWEKTYPNSVPILSTIQNSGWTWPMQYFSSSTYSLWFHMGWPTSPVSTELSNLLRTKPLIKDYSTTIVFPLMLIAIIWASLVKESRFFLVFSCHGCNLLWKKVLLQSTCARYLLYTTWLLLQVVENSSTRRMICSIYPARRRHKL